jgi:hypothetical protein
MELLNYIFRLGVVFAIYGFIWGIFEIGISILRSGRTKTVQEDYVIKAIKYLFLVDVTFLFCLDLENDNISIYHLTMAGLVLLTYFMGKLQNQQNQLAVFKMMGQGGLSKMRMNFNLKAEISVIIIAISAFILFINYPDFSKNPISIWFHESILNIEDTPIFGFIFKVIGFFFLLSMLVKMVNAFTYLISGKPFVQASSKFQQFNGRKKKDDFDDYEELN